MTDDRTWRRLIDLEAKVIVQQETIAKLEERIEALEIQTQSGRFEPQ